MSGEMPESFTELAQNTSLHGLRFLNPETNVFRKIFWSVCLLGAAGFCVIQMKTSVEYYHSRPFSTVATITRESKHTFPEVTICNVNSIHTGKYTKLMKKRFPNITDGEVEKQLSLVSKSFRVLFDSSVGTVNSTVNTTVTDITAEDLTNISSNIDDILLPKELLSCTWDGKTCGAEHFKTFHFAKYIKCFTFEPPDLEVDRVGYEHGLRLRMNVGADWYLPNFYEPFVGQKVVVHPRGQYPEVDVHGFLIQPGLHTSCAVNPVQFISLEKPFRTNCGEEELKFITKESYSYNRNLCMQDCYYKTLVERCHCKTIEMSGDLQLPLCLDERQIYCVFALSKNLTHEASFSRCSASCRESCKYTLFKTKLSTAKLHGKHMADDIDAFCEKKNHKPSLCQDIRRQSHMEKIQFVRDNIVSLEVFLESEYYEEIKQVPAFEWFELMSDIGGNLGLFLGASILTLTEFVDYIIRILWHKLCLTVKSRSMEIKSRDSSKL